MWIPFSWPYHTACGILGFPTKDRTWAPSSQVRYQVLTIVQSGSSLNVTTLKILQNFKSITAVNVSFFLNLSICLSTFFWSWIMCSFTMNCLHVISPLLHPILGSLNLQLHSLYVRFLEILIIRMHPRPIKSNFWIKGSNYWYILDIPIWFHYIVKFEGHSFTVS